MVQPGAGIAPVTLGGDDGDAQHGSAFLEGKPDEVAELDELGLAGVVRGQKVEGLVHRQHFLSLSGRGDFRHVHCDVLLTSAPLQALLAARVFHQNLPHGLGCGAEKVIAILELGDGQPHRLLPRIDDAFIATNDRCYARSFGGRERDIVQADGAALFKLAGTGIDRLGRFAHASGETLAGERVEVVAQRLEMLSLDRSIQSQCFRALADPFAVNLLTFRVVVVGAEVFCQVGRPTGDRLCGDHRRVVRHLMGNITQDLSILGFPFPVSDGYGHDLHDRQDS